MVQHTYIFYFWQLRGSRSHETPKAMSSPNAQILISFSSERNQGSLEKWLVLEPGQDTYKMTLERLVEPERSHNSSAQYPAYPGSAISSRIKLEGTLVPSFQKKNETPQASSKSMGPFHAFCTDSLARIFSLLLSSQCDLTFHSSLAPLRSSH